MTDYRMHGGIIGFSTGCHGMAAFFMQQEISAFGNAHFVLFIETLKSHEV